MNTPIFQTKKHKTLDAVILSDSTNIGYMCGFWGSFGRLIILRSGKKILISDSRYSSAAQKICHTQKIEYREINQKKEFFQDISKEFGITTLGIEADDISLTRYKGVKKAFKGVNLIPLEEIVEPLRLIKTEREIQKIKKSAEIGDACLHETIKYLSAGITESQLAWIFEKTAREQFHCEALSFPTIVAFGEHTASPHHTAGEKKLEENMPILIDCGVKKDGYCSDLTRCFWFGPQNTSEFNEWEKVYTLVHQAQKAGIEKMQIGEKISRSDIDARKVFGLQENYFGHAFGHGLGLDVHEDPVVSSKNTKQVYQSGMVITAEPGLYYPRKFGIRIEDLLVIREHQAEFLSGFEYYKKT